LAPGCLITRPEPGLAATAARVAALGWVPVLAPALVLAPRPIGPVPPVQAAILPSAAAIPALSGALPGGTPVLAVGEATAAAARAAGFPDSRAAAGDAASLAALAAVWLDPAAGPLLLAAGEGYGAELAADLQARGFEVIRRDAYAAAEATALPGAALRALAEGRVSAALFFSPRSARAVLTLLRAVGLGDAATGIRALALSGRVAEALSGIRAGDGPSLAWGGLDVAPRPDQDALLGLLGPAPPSPEGVPDRAGPRPVGRPEG